MATYYDDLFFAVQSNIPHVELDVLIDDYLNTEINGYYDIDTTSAIITTEAWKAEEYENLVNDVIRSQYGVVITDSDSPNYPLKTNRYLYDNNINTKLTYTDTSAVIITTEDGGMCTDSIDTTVHFIKCEYPDQHILQCVRVNIGSDSTCAIYNINYYMAVSTNNEDWTYIYNDGGVVTTTDNAVVAAGSPFILDEVSNNVTQTIDIPDTLLYNYAQLIFWGYAYDHTTTSDGSCSTWYQITSFDTDINIAHLQFVSTVDGSAIVDDSLVLGDKATTKHIAGVVVDSTTQIIIDSTAWVDVFDSTGIVTVDIFMTELYRISKLSADGVLYVRLLNEYNDTLDSIILAPLYSSGCVFNSANITNNTSYIRRIQAMTDGESIVMDCKISINKIGLEV